VKVSVERRGEIRSRRVRKNYHKSLAHHPRGRRHEPFHNIALCWNSPLKLMRGEFIDCAIANADWGDADTEEAAPMT